LLNKINPRGSSVCTDCHSVLNPFNHSGLNPNPYIQPPPPLATPDPAINLLQIKDRINFAEPFESLILTKPIGYEHYEETRFFDTEYETFFLDTGRGATVT